MRHTPEVWAGPSDLAGVETWGQPASCATGPPAVQGKPVRHRQNVPADFAGLQQRSPAVAEGAERWQLRQSLLNHRTCPPPAPVNRDRPTQ
ncbi:MAG: hypothetical protein KDK08_29920, partial [Rhizobiaceae bacterium]|nr:hypothetical protein [Rhizobiaceae bacterium]